MECCKNHAKTQNSSSGRAGSFKTRPDMDSPRSVDAQTGIVGLPSSKNGVVMLGKCLYKLAK